MILKPEILLHPNIPKPLHGLNPRSILGQEWWDEKRQAAYAENDYCCWACGVEKQKANYHQWLEAHECYSFDYVRGIAEMIEITALCHSCHAYIHNGLLEKKYRSNQIPKSMYLDIIKHGGNIIKNIDIIDNPYVKDDSFICKDWSKWHLIIDGKKYFSKFKDYDEWEKHYARF